MLLVSLSCFSSASLQNPENQIYTTAPASPSRFFPLLSPSLRLSPSSSRRGHGRWRRARAGYGGGGRPPPPPPSLPHLPLTPFLPHLPFSLSLPFPPDAAADATRGRAPCGWHSCSGGARRLPYLFPILCTRASLLHETLVSLGFLRCSCSPFIYGAS